MPLDLNDPSTWEASTLNTPVGPVDYWVLADLPAYHEQYQTDGNMTRVPIAVGWHDANTFKRYALGFAERAGTGLTYLKRHGPLECPFQTNQYLSDLRKKAVHVGTSATGVPAYAEPNFLSDNWFTLPATAGMPPRIVYDATFTCPPYDVIDQDTFTAGGFNEQKRFVIYEEQSHPRERRVPSFGFETDDGSATPIGEVGFVPFVEYEFTWTWVDCPYALVPRTAIANCLVKVNNATFGYSASADPNLLVGTTYGRYQTGDILFKGLASKIRPHRGPNGEWLATLPYVFSFQPADGTGSGQLKVPRNNGTWVKIREKGSVASPKYMYGSANLDTLFQPES